MSSSDTPPKLTRSTNGWTRYQIAQLEKLMDAKMDTLRAMVLDARAEAKEAKTMASKPHGCLQEVVLETLNKSVAGWTTWWKRMMITIISAIVAFGVIVAGWYMSHEQVQEDVGELQTDVEKIEVDVKNIAATQTEIKNSINRTATFRTSGGQKEMIKEAFREIVKEQESTAARTPRRARRPPQ